MLTPGSMGEAENVVVDRAGRFTKRTGWGRLPRTAETGETVPSPDRVDVAGAELLQVDTQEQSLWSWSPGRERWERVGSLPEFRVERRPLARPVVSVALAGLVRFGAEDRYELLWWQYFDPGGPFLDVWAQIRDAQTGTLIQRDAPVFSPPRLTFPTALRVGTSAWVVYAGGDVRAQRYGGDLATFSNFLLHASPSLTFDAYGAGSQAVVVSGEFDTGNIRISRHDETGATLASATVVAPEKVVEVACAPGSSGEIWIGAILDPGRKQILVWRLTGALAVVAGYPVTVETDLEDAASIIVGTAPSGDCYVAWEKELTSADPEDSLHIRAVFSSTNTVSSWRKTSYRQGILGRFLNSGRALYLPVGLDGDGNLDDGGVIHGALMRVDDEPSATPSSLSALLLRGDLAGRALGQRWQPTENGWRLAVVSRVRVESFGRSVAGVDVIDVEEEGRRHAPALSLAEQAPVWGICGLWSFDGYDAHDLVITQPPELDFDSLTGFRTGAGPYFAEGDYVYIARYERVDHRGVLHVSPWSKPLILEVPADTVEAISVQIRNTQATRHGRVGPTRLGVALYRTEADGAAAGVIRYYRLTEMGTSGPHFSSVTDERIAYEDEALVASSVGLGVWTNAGRLPPFVPPPPRDLLACGGRLWLVAAEPGREVWFSQRILAQETPWFHPGLSLQLLDTEEKIEALASLDDRVVIFTRSRIYVVEGEGPLDTGTGSFVGPNLISSAFGCVDRRSVISTSRGVYFLAACGICLLDRGLSVQVVGDPVRDLTESGTLVGVVYDEAQARVIWHRVWGEGLSSLILYDERHAVWTTASSSELNEIRGLAWDRGRSALALGYSGGVALEGYGATSGFDGPSSNPTWVPASIRSPWLRTGDVGSWSLLRCMHLEAEACADSTWQVQLDTDYGEAARQTCALTFATVARGDRLVRQVAPKSQTAGAFRVGLVEQAPSSLPADRTAPQGVRWWGLALELEQQVGLARIPATQRAGMTT